MILPMMIQQVLAITVSTADSMMIAKAGEEAVSGVSLVGTLDVLLVIAFSSMVTGGTVAIAHALGRQERAFGCECAKQLVYITLIISVMVALPVGIFRSPLLSLLYGQAEEKVLVCANDYLRIMVISFPFLALYESGVAIFRTMGDTVTGLVLSVIANILNVVGNAVFIFAFQMGAAGAALATLIARAVCAVIIMAMICNKKRTVHIERLFYYRPHKGVIKKILNIGVPHGIESSMFQVGKLATQILISTMGTAGIAANSVANTFASYLYLPAGAISNATITVVGRCYGAGEKEQAKKYAKLLLRWTFVCMWVVSAGLLLFSKPLIGIYNLSEEGAKIAFDITLIHLIATCLIRPFAFSLPSTFKAAGDVRFSMVVSTISMWTIRVGGSYLIAPESFTVFGITVPALGMGIIGVWVAMIGDWVLRTVLYAYRFYKDIWLVKGKK